MCGHPGPAPRLSKLRAAISASRLAGTGKRRYTDENMTMIRSLLAFCLCAAAGAASAQPAMTADDTVMRAAPSPHARVVQRIPARAQIDIGECGELWCAASWRDISGFVRVETIAANDAPLEGPPPPRPYFYGGPVVVGPVFGFGYYHHW
jgi:hypothetical protein